MQPDNDNDGILQIQNKRKSQPVDDDGGYGLSRVVIERKTSFWSFLPFCSKEETTQEVHVPNKYQTFPVRWFVLFTSSFYFFAIAVVDDLVTAAVPTIKKNNNLTSYDVEVLYSVSPVTALLASIATAFLVNYASLRTLSVIATSLILLGNTVFIYSDSYWWKFVGRAIFGVGEGPLEVLMSLIKLRWFVENDIFSPTLELAFGVSAAAGMLGGSAGLIGIPWLLEIFPTNDTMAYALVNLTACAAVMISVGYWLLDYWAKDFLKTQPQNLQPEEQVSVWKVTKSLSGSYWILFTMIGTLWSIIYVITVIITDFLADKWFFQDNFQSGIYASIIFFVGVPVSIVTGWYVSKYGNSLSLIILSGVIFSWSCLMLGLTTFNPLAGIIGLGIATGVFEPTVSCATARCLPEEGSDTAYSFTAIIFQVILFAAPLLFSYFKDYQVEHPLDTDKFQSYDIVMIACSSIGILTIILAIWLSKINPDLEKVSESEEENVHYSEIKNLVSGDEESLNFNNQLQDIGMENNSINSIPDIQTLAIVEKTEEKNERSPFVQILYFSCFSFKYSWQYFFFCILGSHCFYIKI